MYNKLLTVQDSCRSVNLFQEVVNNEGTKYNGYSTDNTLQLQNNKIGSE